MWLPTIYIKACDYQQFTLKHVTTNNLHSSMWLPTIHIQGCEYYDRPLCSQWNSYKWILIIDSLPLRRKQQWQMCRFQKGFQRNMNVFITMNHFKWQFNHNSLHNISSYGSKKEASRTSVSCAVVLFQMAIITITWSDWRPKLLDKETAS